MINKDWSGALPASVVYNTDGEQVSFHNGKMSYEEFKNSVLKLTDK